MSIIDYLIIYAFSFSGVHYHYGGDSPLSGYDCSGYVLELLKASGVVGYNVDLSAQKIYDLLSTPKLGTVLLHPQAGAVSFYGHSKHAIDHVGFCVNEKMMLEAAGGTSATLTKDDALISKAYVKLRPIKYRKDFLFAILPAY